MASTSPESDMSPINEPCDVVVIIVSYECRDLVVACVERITTTRWRHQVDVLVVDNGSTDGTQAAISDRCPVVQMGLNAGFAVANNTGFAMSRSRHVLVLNPDTLVDAGSIDLLVDFLDAHPEAGVVAPRLVNPDGSDQLTARAFPTPWAALFGRRSPLTRWFPNNRFSVAFLAGRDAPGDGPFQVDWVSGAAMAVPRSVIDLTGGFDSEFFMFWEDADWCHRIIDSGRTIWCQPAALVVHDEGGTRSKRYSPRLIRSFHMGAYLYWRNHHASQPWNPGRWLAATALGTRAAFLIVIERVREARLSGPPSISPASVSYVAPQTPAR